MFPRSVFVARARGGVEQELAVQARGAGEPGAGRGGSATPDPALCERVVARDSDRARRRRESSRRVMPSMATAAIFHDGWRETTDLLAAGSGSPEHGLDVEHRRPVERLERADVHAGAVDREDPHLVQADRVGPRGRAGVEDALDRVGGVAARMHAQDVAVGAIQPGEEDDLVAGLAARRARRARRGRSAATPPARPRAPAWARGGVGQRRLDGGDRSQLEAVVMSSIEAVGASSSPAPGVAAAYPAGRCRVR